MPEETNTIVLELPKTIDVQGARKLTGNLDLEKWNNDLVLHAIRQAIKLWSRNASAGIDGLEEKIKAETEVFNKCLDGTYCGALAVDSTEHDAEVEMMTDLFMDQGISKSEASKRAKRKNARTDYIRMMIGRKENRTEISDEEVNAELSAQAETLTAWKAEYVEEIKARQERKAKLKARLVQKS